jgi:hypothetical protein
MRRKAEELREQYEENDAMEGKTIIEYTQRQSREDS